MCLHNYYWQEPTTTLIIVAPRRPSSMFRVICRHHISTFDSSFQVASNISTPCFVDSSSTSSNTGVRRQHYWQRLIGCTIDNNGTNIRASHAVSDNNINKYYSSNVGRHPRDGHNRPHHGSRPPAISRHGSTRQQWH